MIFRLGWLAGQSPFQVLEVAVMQLFMLPSCLSVADKLAVAEIAGDVGDLS
jgi:hypothetical protein